MAVSTLIVSTNPKRTDLLSQSAAGAFRVTGLDLDSHASNDLDGLSDFDIIVIDGADIECRRFVHRVRANHRDLPIVFVLDDDRARDLGWIIRTDPLITGSAEIVTLGEVASFPEKLKSLIGRAKRRLSSIEAIAKANAQLKFETGTGSWPESLTHRFIERLPVGVVLIRGEQVVEFANRWFREEFALEPDTGQDKNSAADPQTGVLEDIVSWLSSLGPQPQLFCTSETARRSRQGQLRTYELTLAEYEAGQPASNLILVQDITARRELESTRIVAERAAATAHFTAGVNHHMNNILAIIQGCTELMASQTTPNNESYLAKITDAVERAAHINQGLSTYVGNSAARNERFDCGQVVREAVENFKGRAGSGIAVSHASADGKMWISADPEQFRLAIASLLDNALEAVSDSDAIEISVHEEKLVAESHEDKDSRIVIEVRDSGCGLSNEVAERAFDPFFTTKGMATHVGLGLSRVLGFAQQTGGTAEIRGSPGQGANVRMTLPTSSAKQNDS